MNFRPTVPKRGAQRAEDLQHLEVLAQAIRAVRKRAGLTKNDLTVGIADGKRPRVVAHGERGGDSAHLTARTVDDVFASFEDPDRMDFWAHPVWNGAEPDDLRQWFKEARRTGHNEQREQRGSTEEPTKTKREASGIWAEGRFSRIPDALVDSGLIAIMPAPVLRGYNVCVRRADRITGRFFTSHATFARDIGYTGKVKRARTKGAAAMAPLVASGLVTIERSGVPGRATDYKLTVPITDAVINRAREVFSCPPQRGVYIPRGGGQHIPRGGDTKKRHQEEKAKKTRARSKRARSRNKNSAPSALSKQP